VTGAPRTPVPEWQEPLSADHLASIGIRTLHHFHGFIYLAVKDRTAFETYQPFLEGLANTIALTIENKEHERSLKQVNEDLARANENLESLVQERTQELVSTNMALVKEIADRKGAEEALRLSEARLNKAQEIAHVGSWELDLTTDRLTWSDETYRIFGLEPKAFRATYQAFLDAVHPDDRSGVDAAYSGSLREGKDTYEVEHRVVQKSTGEIRHVHEKCEHFRDASHRIIRSVGMVHDITERKGAEEEREKLQAQFLQAQKMESVGRLAGGVAHDFNNMLGVILGHAELAQFGLAPGSPLYDHLQQIHIAAHRSADLTRQLLAFARKQTIAPKVLNLNDAVAGMLKMFRRLIGEDIDLAWIPGKDLWPVKVDPAQIDQVLANLCVNARDAIAGVGKVTLETDKTTFDEAYCTDHKGFLPGRYVMLSVSDDGCGMSKEVLDHVFEPFYTTKSVGQGTGLGLATVYGIVKQNDGFINVYSEPGRGTTFKIYLPSFAGEFMQTREIAAVEPPQGQGEKVLLVEDEAAILSMGQVMLERMGYSVLTAGTPREAIRLAEAHPGRIHLLITDVVMPEMDGRELAARIRGVKPGIKYLFMSGYTANVIAHRGVLDEGVQFIQKPFSIQDLALKVRRALEEA
jgi:PAS domain S-box-containing protein